MAFRMKKENYDIPKESFLTFRILKKKLEPIQIQKLIEYTGNVKDFREDWDVWERGEYIKGLSWKNEGNLWYLLEELQIHPNIIEWNYRED